MGPSNHKFRNRSNGWILPDQLISPWCGWLRPLRCGLLETLKFLHGLPQHFGAEAGTLANGGISNWGWDLQLGQLAMMTNGEGSISQRRSPRGM